MNIVIYGTKDEFDTCTQLLSALPALQYRVLSYTHSENYDHFIGSLSEKSFEMVIILTDGAEGMEGVMAAKRIAPDSSVCWFTNDPGFGVQSHRLECTFFAVKPLTDKLLSTAVDLYNQQRIG